MIEISKALVSRLIKEQFPQWANLETVVSLSRIK